MSKRNSEMKSLEKVSYDNIVKNFSRYTYAYATTNDEYLKRNLHFLQRVYTDSLLQYFSSDNSYTYRGSNKHFLDFIFNENLERLIIVRRLSRFCNGEKLLQKAITIAHNLKSILITLEGIKEREQYMHISKALFPYATSVVQVNIPEICNDEIIKIVAFSCPLLKSLNIRNSSVTGEGIKTLCLNPNGTIRTTSTLQTLNILSTSLKMTEVAFLVQNIPTLEEVMFEEMPEVIEYLYSSDEEDKSIKYNLHILDFKQIRTLPKLSDYLVACVEKCPKVKQIKINVSKPQHLELVSLFLNLESLEVRTESSFLDQQSDLSFNSLLLCIGNGLRYLYVRGASLSVSVLLENCPNLENFISNNITYQEFDKKSEDLLRHLHTLNFEWVVFRNMNSTDSVMKLLNSSPNLENFTLDWCDLRESDITPKLLDFFYKSNLKNLHIKYTEIGIDFLQQLIWKCSSLKTLTLDYCNNLNHENTSLLRQIAILCKKKIDISFTEIEYDEIYSGDTDFGDFGDDD